MTDVANNEFAQLPLRRFIRDIVDGPFGSSLTSSHYSDEGARVIRLGNIGAAHFKDGDAAYIPLEYFKHLRQHEVSPGDLIIAGLGDANHPVGRACVAPAHLGLAIVKADCFRARLDEDRLSHRYTAWALSSSFVSSQVQTLTRGSTRARINLDVAREIQVPTPSLLEQRRIADFLDAETARIDRLSQLRRTQASKLEERYTTAISELTTPGITSADKRHPNWPWLPASTPTTRLGYLAQVQSGVTVHGARERSSDDAEFPYLRVANVQGERVDLSEIKTIVIPRAMARRSTLRAGDVVMTEANGNPDNLGRGAVWNGEIEGMVHQNHVFAIRADQEKLLPGYLSILLATVHGRRYFRFTSTQVGIATTSSSKVLDFPIPVLDLEQQRSVVNEYKNLWRSMERVRDALSRQLNLLAERRQALITAAVTGQFDVSTASGRGVESP
ncbi:restriction endonuclease subunit S [Streptomyces mirabilis]|uniref:restriction endonuclease subunit S n=1 Tax=Streptomyces mirabilis TaxID=68239 RepID=UPI0021BE8933|nr:restriction endonuclease subunit S [Streptomyces mirabilis]MCT9107030.1 restriction endonuclease subunit S [Streptomyces mirabilis]